MLKFDTKKDSLLATLKEMQQSGFMFILTGSRYFETENRYSDYDFFVQDDLEVEEWLIKNGFTIDNASSYCDQNTTRVYQRVFYRDPFVHIQIVDDAAQKELIQKNFKMCNLINEKTSKEEKRKLWRLAYSIAKY